MSSERLMSLSAPGTIITPVPMTTLPTIKAHRARFVAAGMGVDLGIGLGILPLGLREATRVSKANCAQG